jgi:ketosteroid isomerase-like protein
VDTREAAERFARTWEDSWPRGDVAALAELYAEDCVHRSMPFRPVHEGRREVVDYISWSFSTERATEVRFGRPMVDGDLATVEYWVTAVEHEGAKPVTLAGVGLLRFRPDGLVVEARDYWHVADGHQHPTGRLFLPDQSGDHGR